MRGPGRERKSNKKRGRKKRKVNGKDEKKKGKEGKSGGVQQNFAIILCSRIE